MDSPKEKVYRSEMARGVASKLMAELQSACDKLELVGSLRRNKSYVHDIDIIVLPRGRDSSKYEFDRVITVLVERGSLKVIRNGPRVKSFVAVKTGIPIDLYIATSETFFTLMVIRTGSKEHNIKLAMRAREQGMKLLASGEGIQDSKGNLLPIQKEEDVFEILGLAYVLPEDRT